MQGNSIFYLQLFDVINFSKKEINSFIELLSLIPLKDLKNEIITR